MRKSVHNIFHSSMSDKSFYYKNMFTEDISLGIIPFRTFSASDNIVIIDGDTGEQQKAQKLLSSLARYNHHQQLSEVLSDVITYLAKCLTERGICYHEVDLDEGEDYLDTYWFSSRRVFRLFGYYIQWSSSSKSNRQGKIINAVKSSLVWKLTFPKTLDGPYNYRRLLMRLKKLDPLGPKFAQEDIVQAPAVRGYNSMLYRLKTEILVNRITSEWGWNRRDLSTDATTEFYGIYKNLQFKLTQAILRDHIVNELNNLFKKLGILASIELVNLPTERDLTKLSKELSDGTKSFEEVSEVIYKY